MTKHSGYVHPQKANADLRDPVQGSKENVEYDQSNHGIIQREILRRMSL